MVDDELCWTIIALNFYGADYVIEYVFSEWEGGGEIHTNARNMIYTSA